MKTTRKIGLVPVILLCAAFALVPMVAAAGPGQGQAQGGDQKDSDLIAAFLKWLNGQSGS
ncbi:hypothetical protein [Methanoregula sp.]